MQRLLILGAGGFGAAVAEAAQATGRFEVVGFLDDRHPSLASLLDLPVIGRLDHPGPWNAFADVAVAAFGNAALRRRAAQLIIARGLGWPALIHPRAIVSPSARLGRGVVVMAGTVIGTRTTIGDGSLLNAGAVVDHDVTVGEFAHMAVASCAGGGAQLEADSTLGPGESVGPGMHHPPRS